MNFSRIERWTRRSMIPACLAVAPSIELAPRWLTLAVMVWLLICIVLVMIGGYLEYRRFE